MNEVVRYSNELHELKFNTLTEAQQNVFFTLLQQFRNTDGYVLELDYRKVFELANIAESGSYRKDILDKLGKLQEFKFRYEINSKGDLQQDVIFPSIATDSENRVLRVKVSQGFKDRYINSPLKGWTRYELAEFVGLSGTYAKTIYRYLKQYRTSGLWCVKYKDFIELLGIPNSYQSCDIDKRILKPAIKELSAERNLFDQRRTPFKGLIYKKIKSGRNIDVLEFYFEKQPPTEREKDPNENKRSLETIANDIKRQNALKSLKRDSQNPEILKAYLYRSAMVYNSKTKKYDTLKVMELKFVDDKIVGRIQNSDDGYITEMTFESLKHLENFLR